MPEPREHLTIRAFRAIDEPETCALYLREHRRVLEDFGITNVKSNTAQWITSPKVSVIVAEHDDLGLIGGARVHVSHHPHERLPIVNAVGKLDPGVQRLFERLSMNGVAEVCGLWNANRFGGRSLAQVLAMTGISLANQLSARSVLGLAAKYTLNFVKSLGMPEMEEVGNKGWFDYPRPGFYGIVTCAEDALSLEHARPEYRKRMISLRLRPEQWALEVTRTAQLSIDYQLRLKDSLIDLSSYRSIQQNALRYTA